MFKSSGAVGGLLESELSEIQISETSIPENFQLWQPLFSPILFMNSRHCLVRNCNDCGKEVMDDWCLPNCTREATVYDSEDREIYITKTAGFYNTVHNSKVRFNPDRIGNSSTLLLDFRAPHDSLLPEMELGEFIELIQKSIDGDAEALVSAENAIEKWDRAVLPGLEPLLSCD